MKKVLIYGDSNVWGKAFGEERLPDESQWPNVLQERLGSGYKIIQEGLCSRIAGDFDKNKPHRNGKMTFRAIFRTAAPIDIILIALGTNDLQKQYGRSADVIIEDLLWYEEIIKEEFATNEDKKSYFVNRKMPAIIYVLPPSLDYLGEASVVFDAESEAKRKKVNGVMQECADCVGLDSIDLSDGVHYSIAGHVKAAQTVEHKIRGLE